MSWDVKDTQPKELASAVNLFVHPVAGVAAWSAFGFGLAGHAFGVWMGALAGAGNAAQRLLDANTKPEAVSGGQAGVKTVGSPRKRVPAGEKAAVTQAAPVTAAPRSDAMSAVHLSSVAVQPVPANNMRLTDDLKAIAGVGPKLEQVLNGLGVRSYAQIAAWTDEEVARIEDALGLQGRIARDDWVGQAAALAQAGVKH